MKKLFALALLNSFGLLAEEVNTVECVAKNVHVVKKNREEVAQKSEADVKCCSDEATRRENTDCDCRKSCSDDRCPQECCKEEVKRSCDRECSDKCMDRCTDEKCKKVSRDCCCDKDVTRSCDRDKCSPSKCSPSECSDRCTDEKCEKKEVTTEERDTCTKCDTCSSCACEKKKTE